MIDQRFLDDLAQDLVIPDENQEEMQLASANTGVTTDGGAFVGYRMNMPKGLNTRENQAKQSALIANTLGGGTLGGAAAGVGLTGDILDLILMGANALSMDMPEKSGVWTTEDVTNWLASKGINQENISGLIDKALPSGATEEEKARAFGGGQAVGELAAPGTQLSLIGKAGKGIVKGGVEVGKKIIEAGKDLPVGMSIKGVDTKDFVNVLKNQIDGLELDLYESSKGDVLTLSRIEVPKDMRKSGVGSQVMTEVTKFADENGKTIALSPSTDFGATSTGRLKDFYKQFGFVENKGRNKDFSISESMYRKPVSEENK